MQSDFERLPKFQPESRHDENISEHLNLLLRKRNPQFECIAHNYHDDNIPHTNLRSAAQHKLI